MKARLIALFERHRQHLLVNYPELYVARVHVLVVAVPLLATLALLSAALQAVSLDDVPGINAHWLAGLAATLCLCIAWGVFVVRDARLLPSARGWRALRTLGLYLACCSAIALPALVENVTLVGRVRALDASLLVEGSYLFAPGYADDILQKATISTRRASDLSTSSAGEDEAARSALAAKLAALLPAESQLDALAESQLDALLEAVSPFLGRGPRDELRRLLADWPTESVDRWLTKIKVEKLLALANANVTHIQEADRMSVPDSRLWLYMMVVCVFVNLVILTRALGAVRLLIATGALLAYGFAWMAVLAAFGADKDKPVSMVALIHYGALFLGCSLVGLRGTRSRRLSWMIAWLGVASPLALLATVALCDVFDGVHGLARFLATSLAFYLVIFPLLQRWLTRARVLPEL